MYLVAFILIVIGPQIWAKKPYGIDASMRMRTMSVDSEQVNAKIFQYRMMFAKDIKVEEDLEIKLDLGFDLETGSNSSNIIQEYAPQRQLRLKNASLAWTPLSLFNFELGAIRQGKGRRLLVGNIPFLGAKAEGILKLGENTSVVLTLQEAIPNNYFLAQRVGNINQEGTPRLSDQRVTLKSEDDAYFLRLQGSKFNINGLSPNVAYQSQFIGNSISGGSEINSDFLYGFGGYYLSSRFEFHLNNDFGMDLDFQYLYNDKAPEETNKGHFALAVVKLFDIGAGFGVFENQSDASAAFYNDGTAGHNNRKGYAFTIGKFRSNRKGWKTKYEYILEYIHKEPIIPNIFQSPEDKIVFYLKKNFII